VAALDFPLLLAYVVQHEFRMDLCYTVGEPQCHRPRTYILPMAVNISQRIGEQLSPLQREVATDLFRVGDRDNAGVGGVVAHEDAIRSRVGIEDCPGGVILDGVEDVVRGAAAAS
jgi:hypothetical protein